MAKLFVVDNGPDWNVSSPFFLTRLWHDTGLDIPCVTSFAAWYSAYNPTEHLRLPLSKKQTSVRFSALATGYTEPLHQIGGISAEEKE